jgi:Ca-activated chloride channel family protein
VSFAWPIALLGLLAIPLLIGLEVLSRRRQARYTVAFTNLELLRDVVGRRSSRRRLLASALLLAGLASLVVALARPQATMTVAKRNGTVVLAMDTSGSMIANDVSPTRIGAATAAAQTFVQKLPDTFEVGLVPFSSSARLLVSPTHDKTAVVNGLRSLQAGGGTSIGDAIEQALGALGVGGTTQGTAAKKGGRTILLLSDGANTSGEDPLVAAQHAKAAGVPIYTIAFGTPDGTVNAGPFNNPVPVPPDPGTLRSVASITGGQSFQVGDSSTLRAVYDHIGTRVGSTKQKHDVTYRFAAGAAVLLLLGAAASVRWRGAIV